MRAIVLSLALLPVLGLTAQQPKEIPAVNQDVLAFVRAHMGKRVGHGECWDLAAEALNTAKADWDGLYGFGKEVKPEEAMPGDIIQFEGVLLESRVETPRETSVHQERYGHHTAIVMEVKAPGVFIIAQQNAGEQGRHVGLDPLTLADRKQGTIRFYRPQR